MVAAPPVAEARRHAAHCRLPRKRPAPTPPDGPARRPAAARPTVEIVGPRGDETVTALGDETWGVVGDTVHVHHSFWGLDDGGSSPCSVVAYIGRYNFPEGAASAHTYVIAYDGSNYPIRHGALLHCLGPDAKRRVRKLPPPRACLR